MGEAQSALRKQELINMAISKSLSFINNNNNNNNTKQ